MISKLPRWVESGAFVLAFIAGCVNAIGLLGFKHQSISHLSGTATLVGTSFVGMGSSDTWHLLMIMLSFVLGSALSGLMLESSGLKLGRHYDSLLLIEGLLLLVAMLLLTESSFWGHYLASAACGLQNAMATTYSGAIVRTTHVTGLFTDIGIMLGRSLKGEHLDRRKMTLLLIIILGFICGASLGAGLFTSFQFNSLMVPASICLLLALGYRLLYRRRSNKA
ncbi:DUF1275 domain-containing protein [Alginatibacterium sediminis]|uniref:DUF1275 domain-containing protein n=1 Tax=Alginatibacterium sediminis TaxID=2164068 RepID=A0A420EDM2_9ALTE|nr:YoaK family protein [Alginatibacterium sediminis]RKF18766.1 DUF1275 domain-containing protein [Alginatibacterium sediminis]